MDKLRISAIVISLIKKLHEKGSWCGETHIQKAVFFLQELTNINLEFNYILYKHGPFSFELREKLNEMIAEKKLNIEPTHPNRYGPTYIIGDIGKKLDKYLKPLIEEYSDKINIAGGIIGNRTVASIEPLSTALFLIKKYENWSNNKRAKYMEALKPHITFESAKRAIEKIEGIMSNVEQN